jgi:hypothetical protein
MIRFKGEVFSRGPVPFGVDGHTLLLSHLPDNVVLEQLPEIVRQWLDKWK